MLLTVCLGPQDERAQYPGSFAGHGRGSHVVTCAILQYNNSV